MALSRPTFKVNVSANKKATERKSIFYDIAPDSSVRLRVMPPVTEDGMLFTVVSNHFKLKSDEGMKIALACLREHGNPEIGTDCYLCDLVRHLKTGDKAEQKIAKDIEASRRWYLQCLIYDKAEDEYFGPKLVGLSRTTAEQVQSILSTQDEVGDAYFCDPDKGQDIIITRKGSGLASKYSSMPSNKIAALSDIFPGWEDKLIMDVYKTLELKIYDVDEQKKTALRTFGDELDWEAVEAAIG